MGDRLKLTATGILTILLLVLGAGCHAQSLDTTTTINVQDPDKRQFATPGMELMARAAVRIRTFCDGDLYSYGSGTAIGPHTIISAKHMVLTKCDTPSYLVSFSDGTDYPVQAGLQSEEFDVATFTILPEWGEFQHWATISYAEPRLGQRVYLYTGDGTVIDMVPFFFKDGLIGAIDETSIVVQSHGVPGNSGCGVFDADGNLLAVLWGGRWDPSTEFLYIATRPAEWPGASEWAK